jgi:two-component system CheB/CheR fusion protein
VRSAVLERGLADLIFRRLAPARWEQIERRVGRCTVSVQGLSCSGEVLGCIVVLTPREAQPHTRLIEAFVRLAAIVAERMNSDEALRRADRNRNEFLAVLSHELRNPLMPIRNCLRVLERAREGSEQASRARVVIDRQVGYLSRLLDDLLDVTRLTRGKIQLKLESLDLNELARATVEDHRSLFQKADVEVEFTPAPQPVRVRGDPTRLAQIIGNVLGNAAKFTPAGGHTHLVVDVHAETAQAVLRVTDTGVGIAPELLGHMFEPFTQADRTLDRSGGGLGLGLTLVKGLTEMHGGSVAAESRGHGAGTSIVVRLPLELQRAEQGAATVTASRSAARRVLVIEDNRDAATSLQEALELGDHAVEVAFDGRSGIDKARASLPDVILCDIGLPGMDGFAVARVLRADPVLRAIPLVALTGYADPEDIEKAKKAGFDRHVAKPPALEDLERVIDELSSEPFSRAAPQR